MKTNTVLVLTATGILLTGSAAFAVNSQPLNGSPSGSPAPANNALPTSSESAAGPASPTSTPSPAATEDASSGSQWQPAALVRAEPNRGPSTSAVPSPAEDRAEARLVAPEPVPSRSVEPSDDHGEQEPGDDHGGHREQEPGDDHGGHGEQEPGDDKRSSNDD